MSQEPPDVQRLSADRLMTGFSKSRIALCLIVAIGVHVLLLASTSVRYINDTWIDPDGAKLRLAEKQRKRDAARADERRRREARAAAATQRAATRKAASKPSAGDDEKVPDRAKNSKIYKATTQAADPKDIPKVPDNMTVPFDD